jgi:hypothetical protein
VIDENFNFKTKTSWQVSWRKLSWPAPPLIGVEGADEAAMLIAFAANENYLISRSKSFK